MDTKEFIDEMKKKAIELIQEGEVGTAIDVLQAVCSLNSMEFLKGR